MIVSAVKKAVVMEDEIDLHIGSITGFKNIQISKKACLFITPSVLIKDGVV